MFPALFLALVPLSTPLLQDPPPAPPTPPAEKGEVQAPDPAKIEQVARALDAAFQKGEAGERLRAVQAAAGVEDAKVISGVAKGLKDKDLAVRKAAIEVLRFSTHPSSLAPLHALAKRPETRKDAPLYAAVLRAIGQHGSPESIEILTDNPWNSQDAAVIEARILGLGKIRTKESVKALIDLTEVAGPRKIDPFMRHFRASLASLTGADQGSSQELWLRWWRENKDTLKVAPEEPALPKDLARYWHRYWAPPGSEPEEGERARGDRPPKDGEPPPPKPDGPPPEPKPKPPGEQPPTPPKGT
jgi:hypothetical protein